MGISTFLPNKEQAFHVRNWASAMDQLTSINHLQYTIFSLPAWETLPLFTSISASLGQTLYLCKTLV